MFISMITKERNLWGRIKREGCVRRWLSLKVFQADVEWPEERLNFVKKNNKKPWGPKNYEWITTIERVNRCLAVYLPFRGKKRTLKEIAEILGLSVIAVRRRIDTHGVKSLDRPKNQIYVQGKTRKQVKKN